MHDLGALFMVKCCVKDATDAGEKGVEVAQVGVHG
jgi:hypothetical protein